MMNRARAPEVDAVVAAGAWNTLPFGGPSPDPAPATPHRLLRRPPPALSGLLVPADPAGAVRVVVVADASVAISDVLGSVLLDDVVTWATPGGVRVSVYLGEDRATAPDNPCLSLIATRLGLTDRAFHATARGDALILGTGPTGTDEDLHSDVVAEVGRCGITAENAQGMTAGACRACG